MAPILELSTPQYIKNIGDFTVNKTIKELFIINVIDTGEDVDVTLGLQAGPGDSYTIRLWNNDEYQKIGQWTDKNVDAKILELLKIN